MGKGTFENGKFTLHLSFQYTPSNWNQEIELWQRAIGRASEMLYNATNGQMQFGTIKVFSNVGGGSDDADIWLFGPEDSRPTGVPLPSGHHVSIDKIFGTPGFHMQLANHERFQPFIILHEFGHYGLGLGDEYMGGRPGEPTFDTRCCDPTRPDGHHACIMGVAMTERTIPPTVAGGQPTKRFSGDVIDETTGDLKKGWVTEFCTDHNHERHIPSIHNGIHNVSEAHGGKSCAQVILDNFKIDVTSGVGEDELPGHEAIEWVGVDALLRATLAFDDTSALGGPLEAGGIAGLRESARYWEQTADPNGGRVSVVTFGTAASGLEGLEEHPDASRTTIEQALEAATEEIIGERSRAATEAVVLFSSGRDQGAEPDRAIDHLAREGIRVFAIGVGPDREKLHRIAERTRGEFYELSPRQGPTAIRDQVMRLADILLFGPPILEVDATERFLPVTVEKGSKRAKFVASHRREADAQLIVRRPDRTVVGPNDRDVTVLDSRGRAYHALSIESPQPGTWQVRLEPPQDGEPFRSTLSVYSENPRVHLAVTGAERRYRVSDTVTLHAVVSAPMPVTALAELAIRVTPPRGSESDRQQIDLKPHFHGVHVGAFDVTRAGAHQVELVVRNDGSAIPAGLRDPTDERWRDTLDIPEFQRVKRFQIHVSGADE